ncbi:MAG TPA: hypothetical protein VMP01_15470 [Pirellulaceae bacterium]|nr:hypothetical protein [Pirellulaceae bacterium]
MFKFTIRDVACLTLVVSLGAAWWSDHDRLVRTFDNRSLRWQRERSDLMARAMKASANENELREQLQLTENRLREIDAQKQKAALFIHPKTGQRIYAMEYQVEKKSGAQQTIIVRLSADGKDANGNSRPEDPSKRLVSVGPGDWLINGGECWRIKSARLIDSSP